MRESAFASRKRPFTFHSSTMFERPIASRRDVNSSADSFVSVMFAWIEMKRSMRPLSLKIGFTESEIQYALPSRW